MSAFEPLADRLRCVAKQQPQALALGDGQRLLDYQTLDRLVDRVAAALQRDGVATGQAVASCAATGVLQAVWTLGTLRAGAVPAPIAPSVTAVRCLAGARGHGASAGGCQP
jgi:acyl-CoA synthetase (AMP-forming)/AMP-acid ligase II